MKKMKGFQWIVACIVIVFCLGVFLWSQGYRWNASHSYPKGIWRIVKSFDRTTDKEKLVLICPTDIPIFNTAKDRHYLRFGWCKGGYHPLLKRVVGLPGDKISISKDGVKVNHFYISNSQPLHIDSQGRILKTAQSLILKAGQVWVMSEFNSNSFDSRYFGPLPLINILGVVEPVWLLEAF